MVEEAGKEQARREQTRFEGVFLWEGEGNVLKDYHQGPVRAQRRLETMGGYWHRAARLRSFFQWTEKVIGAGTGGRLKFGCVAVGEDKRLKELKLLRSVGKWQIMTCTLFRNRYVMVRGLKMWTQQEFMRTERLWSEVKGNRIRVEDFRHEALVVGDTKLQGMAISVGSVRAKTL